MSSAENALHGGPMFSFFLVTMGASFLLPYTLYRLKAKPLQLRVSKPKLGRKATPPPPSPLEPYVPMINKALKHHLVFFWAIFLLLLAYTARHMHTMKSFDPYAILDVPHDASENSIRRAYRQLSLQYHPDKNPDPKAPQIQKQITMAYEALTVPERKKNWEEFGHPDGQQAFEEGVALPSWFVSQTRAGSLVLLSGILLVLVVPLALAMRMLGG